MARCCCVLVILSPVWRRKGLQVQPGFPERCKEMKFDVQVLRSHDGVLVGQVEVEESNWYGAMVGGLELLGVGVDLGALEIELASDGQSARVEAGTNGLVILVAQESDGFDAGANLEDTIIEDIPVPDFGGVLQGEPLEEEEEEPTPDELLRGTFQLEGGYAPGLTTDFLTHAFMRLADLFEDFGDDRDGAMAYVEALVLDGIKAVGGGVMLTDINDPQASFWFGRTWGEHAEELMPLQAGANQGIVGYCAKMGVGANLEELGEDGRFQDDLLFVVEPDVGPVLCMPMEFKDRLLGMMLVYRRKGEPEYTQSEQSILSYLAFSMADYFYRAIEAGS